MPLSKVDGPALENSGVAAGTYGSASAIPALTIDAKGRVTSASTNSFSSSYVGARGQVFTTAGSGQTFTIPAGVTAVKVTVVGGGSGATQSSGYVAYYAGSGGTSSVSSGTQAISTISATGGVAATASVLASGGVGVGGLLNGRGGGGNGSVPNSILSFSQSSGSTAGAGTLGSGAWGNSGTGGAGGHSITFLTGLTPGNTLSVTVGAGGSAAAAGGQPGGTGVVIFEW